MVWLASSLACETCIDLHEDFGNLCMHDHYVKVFVSFSTAFQSLPAWWHVGPALAFREGEIGLTSLRLCDTPSVDFKHASLSRSSLLWIWERAATSEEGGSGVGKGWGPYMASLPACECAPHGITWLWLPQANLITHRSHRFPWPRKCLMVASAPNGSRCASQLIGVSKKQLWNSHRVKPKSTVLKCTRLKDFIESYPATRYQVFPYAPIFPLPGNCAGAIMIMRSGRAGRSV